MAEQWLSIVEYARHYKVSDMTVRRRIKTGKLHAVLKEGKYFIPVAANDSRGSGMDHTANHMAEPHYEDQSSPSTPRRHSGEMSLIKGHPAAHKTYSQPPHELPRLPTQPSAVETREIRANYRMSDEGDGANIPTSLRRPLTAQETSLVDTRALLAYCDASLRKLGENERRTVDKFKSKLEALEATLASKDFELKSLKQQVEDLQLLVKILEKKRMA